MTEAITPFAEPCRPPWWARGGHSQTIWGSLLPFEGALPTSEKYERIEVDVSEGDRLLVHARRGTSGVRVLLFHGLSGSAESDYVQRAALVFERAGHDVWAVNHRGCGDGRGLARRPYHSGRYDDLERVIAVSRARDPERTLIVIGYSLSGNAALLLAGKRDQPVADGIVSVNPPIDLAAVAEAIDRPACRLYQMRFMIRLRASIRGLVEDGAIESAPKLSVTSSMRELDDRFTAPQSGFEDALDYYARCSAGPHLARVATPAVLISAADDPFIDPEVYGRFERSRFLHFHLEQTGGHVGYLERRSNERYGYWLERALVHYTSELARLHSRSLGAFESRRRGYNAD